MMTAFIFMYGQLEITVEQINNSTGAVTYLHHDQQGSTRLLTGSTGKTEATFTYGPYGGVTGSTGTAATPLGYDAQYTSQDTGLIYLRNRVYDPATAQFLTVDPLVGITGEPYSFAFDNPVNLVDPSGLEAIPFPVAGPQDLGACADPITIAICGAGGVYAAKELYNAFAGEAEPGNDEGEALVKRQAEEAEQACNAEIARGIAGHAGEHFPGQSEDETAQEIERILDNPDALSRDLAHGRRAYYEDGKIVIHNPNVPYGGTAYPGTFDEFLDLE
jgi:RHS repeat-associated protein